jgi:hypothetical protein
VAVSGSGLIKGRIRLLGLENAFTPSLQLVKQEALILESSEIGFWDMGGADAFAFATAKAGFYHIINFTNFT